MYLALVSASGDPDITRPLLDRIAEALEFQQMAHYAPFWQSDGLKVKVFTSVEGLQEDDGCPLVIFDDPDQANALGYHSVGPGGKSYGRAFWNIIKNQGGSLIDGAFSLSNTLSHEALEMVGNPYVNFWADLPSDVEGQQEAIELCDRVENDSYKIADVSVSNFLGPRAFRDGPGPYDHLRLLNSPWEIRPGGYCIRRLAGGGIVDVWGANYPEWRRELKFRAGSRTMRRHAVQGE